MVACWTAAKSGLHFPPPTQIGFSLGHLKHDVVMLLRDKPNFHNRKWHQFSYTACVCVPYIGNYFRA